MRKNLFTVGVVILIALLATSAFAKNRGVQFMDLGYLEPRRPTEPPDG